MTAFQYAIARAAYDAYHEVRDSGECPQFDSIGYQSQRAWQAAAEAVADKLADISRGVSL